jgi:hypothetical protein
MDGAKIIKIPREFLPIIERLQRSQQVSTLMVLRFNTVTAVICFTEADERTICGVISAFENWCGLKLDLDGRFKPPHPAPTDRLQHGLAPERLF